jgi:hypothetical protein
MKRIGLLALALVLALGTLGVGYAAWTDTINISGTVNTGSVDLNVVSYSGTWIYKDLDNDALVLYHWKLSPEQMASWNKILVAYAEATAGATDDSVVVTIDNAFPCQELTADFVIKYAGTIPVKVDAEITGTTGDALLLAPYTVVKFYWYNCVTHVIGAEITDVVQMHENDCVYCVMSLHLPQDNALMNLSGTFTAEINAVQWNEYPLPTTTPP